VRFPRGAAPVWVALVAGAAILFLVWGTLVRNPVATSLEHAVRAGGDTPIRIAALTSFPWDRMFVYMPYSRAFVEHGREMQLDEDEYLLVFCLKGHRIRHVTLSHGLVAFARPVDPGGYTPQTAVFRRDARGYLVEAL
jgi:hypothetical protein